MTGSISLSHVLILNTALKITILALVKVLHISFPVKPVHLNTISKKDSAMQQYSIRTQTEILIMVYSQVFIHAETAGAMNELAQDLKWQERYSEPFDKTSNILTIAKSHYVLREEREGENMGKGNKKWRRERMRDKKGESDKKTAR